MLESRLARARRGECSGQREQRAKSGLLMVWPGQAAGWGGGCWLRGLGPLRVKGVVEGGDQEWCDPAAASEATGRCEGERPGAARSPGRKGRKLLHPSLQLPEARDGEGRLQRRGSQQARYHGDRAAAPQLPRGEKGLLSTPAGTAEPAEGGWGGVPGEVQHALPPPASLRVLR